jgi:glycosyltransferase involved in cell wall biosynthesis
LNLAIILPALNEEESLPLVLADLRRVLLDFPALGRYEIIVADNRSSDRTVQFAEEGAAHVVTASRRGYGSACLKALSALSPISNTLVFMDADHSDFAEDLPALLEPIQAGTADLVIGARRPIEAGALTLQQKFGNALACSLMQLLYRFRYTDLGPFRAIRRESLESLEMKDPAFGWTVEMQLKALKKGLRVCEVPVRYRKRIGRSKISGTIAGSLQAGMTILWTIAKFAIESVTNSPKL